jgi:hypothetical protein
MYIPMTYNSTGSTVLSTRSNNPSSFASHGVPEVHWFSMDAQQRYDPNPALGSSFNCISSLELNRGGTIVLY